MIAGRATPDGTRRLAGDRPGYRPLGATGLTVSTVGFGGYRTGRREPRHRAALRAALAGGVNLVDTSSNYMLGDSERLIGEVLAEGLVPREGVVVVSKIGYLQGPNLELAQQREAERRPFPDMVKYAQGVWHCMSPEFLDDQLGRALERLGLETIDLLLLHNPEYFLIDAAQQPDGRRLDQTRATFYDRLRRAFAYLDGAVADGRIGGYGVSSNSCVEPAESPEMTSVTRIQEASRGRMTVLQLPYNLLEQGALLTRNTPDGTALEAATAHGLGVLVNRPLNATGNHGLVRLADPPRPGAAGSDEALQTQLAELAEREASLEALFPAAPQLGLVELVVGRLEEIAQPRGFAQFLRGELMPRAQRALSWLVGSVNRQPSPEQAQELRAFQEELNELTERLQDRAQRPSPRVGAEIRATIEPALPAELRGESLSRLALDFVASTPGVSCVLCGMRTEAYVADALGVMTLPSVPDVAAVAAALRGDG
jgi:uncharacterized protein